MGKGITVYNLSDRVYLEASYPDLPWHMHGTVAELVDDTNVRVHFDGQPLTSVDRVVRKADLKPAEPHRVDIDNVAMIKEWLTTRGGLAIWNSHNLANPGASWTCPVLDDKGKPKPAPTWEAGEVIRIILDPKEVLVMIPLVVKVFHVAVRKSSQGLSLKVTAGGTRRIHDEVDKAAKKYGKPAYYRFDYGSTNNVEICIDDSAVPLMA